MNLTINSLYLCLLTTPTFTFLNQNLNFNRIRVSYSFNHFLYGNNAKIQSSLIRQSVFNQFLSAPISISTNNAFKDEDKIVISNQYFTSPQYYTKCCNYKFISNTFSNCISKGDHNLGGAIYIGCETKLKTAVEVNVQIINNCFLNCESDQGGAFYITCYSATIQENSFKGCEAVYYSILYLHIDQEATFTQTHFSFSKKDESSRGNAINVETKRSLVEKNLNISSNKLNSGHSIFYASIPDAIAPKYIYLNFYNNTSKNIISSYSSFSSMIENSNFIRNQGLDSLIEFKLHIKCNGCAFISDNSKLITTKYAIFISCNFDDEEDNVRFSYHSLSNCKFNVEKTIDVKIEAEQVCMTKPNNDQGSNSQKNIFFASFMPVLFITIIVLAVLIILYGIKNNWFKRKTDTIPLMYV